MAIPQGFFICYPDFSQYPYSYYPPLKMRETELKEFKVVQLETLRPGF